MNSVVDTHVLLLLSVGVGFGMIVIVGWLIGQVKLLRDTVADDTRRLLIRMNDLAPKIKKPNTPDPYFLATRTPLDPDRVSVGKGD